MKLRNKLTAIAVAVILFTSCQKEYDPNVPITPVVVNPISDSIYLHMIIDIFDDGTGSGPDTSYTVVHYDSQKRVISINDSIPGVASVEPLYTYAYNGSDTMPYKSILTPYASLPDYDSTVTFYTYDAQGRKLKDSSITSAYYSAGLSKRKLIVNYSYVPGKIFGETISTDLTGPLGMEFNRDTAILDANSNIISNKIYKLNGVNYELDITSVFTFDNKPNPISKLSIFSAHRNFPNGESLGFEFAGYNNILSQDENVISSAFHFNSTSTYGYSLFSGLPILQNKLVSGLPEKLVYTYRSF